MTQWLESWSPGVAKATPADDRTMEARLDSWALGVAAPAAPPNDGAVAPVLEHWAPGVVGPGMLNCLFRESNLYISAQTQDQVD